MQERDRVRDAQIRSRLHSATGIHSEPLRRLQHCAACLCLPIRVKSGWTLRCRRDHFERFFRVRIKVSVSGRAGVAVALAFRVTVRTRILQALRVRIRVRFVLL